MAGCLKASNTRWLSSDPIEQFDRIKLLLQEKQAVNNSNISKKEFFATADKLLEYKCTSTKQHNLVLPECSN